MIIDFTHRLKNDMTVYPDTAAPAFVQDSNIADDGFAEMAISMCTHVGTHIDAPAHIFENAKTIDAFALEKFVGAATVLDCSHMQRISKAFLQENEELLRGLDYILFYTGWQHKWNTDDYFDGFPTLTLQAAQWLTTLKTLQGIGLDAISVDAIDDHQLPNHKTLLSHDILIIENLNNIDKLIGNRFVFSSVPLKIANADGSPVRAFGQL